MFQLFTPVFSPPKFVGLSARPFANFCLTLVLALVSVLGLNATTAFPDLNIGKTGITMLSDTSIEASICNGETYLFNGDLLNTSGEYSATYTLPDGSDSVVTLQLTVLPLSFTNQDVIICEGTGYPFNGAFITEPGTYSFTLPAENGCDSIITLNLKVLPPINTNLSATICDSNYYVFQGDTLTQSGVYSIILPSSQGCDSIVTLKLNVVHFFDIQSAASICAGATYAFGDQHYDASGVYSYTVPTPGGCDSVFTLTLTVLPAIITKQSIALCIGSSYDFYGDILIQDGLYEAVFTAENGCDSTIMLDLSFVNAFETQLEGVICSGSFYDFDSELLDAEGVYTHLYKAQGGCDSTVTLTLSVLPVSYGSDQATICASGYFEYNGSVLTDQGEYTFVFEAANGCDSTVTFTLNVLPAIGTAQKASICAGEIYPFEGESLTDAGVYEAILTAENGCDSIVTLTLTVLPVQQTDLSASICEGTSYDYNGESLTDAGIYEFVYTGANGCDSTVTLTLTVNPLEHTTLEVNICEGNSYEFDGTLVTEAGTYSALYSSFYGCDSTVTLVLSVLPVQNTALEATICANETYPFNGISIITEGVYTAVLTGANGCDSTVVLTLNVLPIQSRLIKATICDGTSYDYNGLALSAAGDYEFIFSGENGCDSTVTVSITVLPNASSSIAASICAGEAYDYNGEQLTDSGDYAFVFPAENGCDSTVTVSLTVLPLLSSTTSATICAGTSYVFNNDTLYFSGTYQNTFTGSNGCDSTATLVLEFVNSFETNLQVSICNGESYVFGNDTLSDSGDFSHLLSAQGGCDSLVTLNLNVLPLTESTTDATICDGQSYDFNGLQLTLSGSYSAALTGANGCDSTAFLNLTVLPVQNSSLEATICANESYAFNGANISDAGTYTAVLSGVNGCDSTVVLTLNVLPTQGSSQSAVICANETYDFYGQSLSQSGTYLQVFQGDNGCDSTITLQLEVLPLAASTIEAAVCDGASYDYHGATLTQSGVYAFTYPGAGANGCDSLETLTLTIYPAIPNTIISATVCVGESYNFYGTFLTAAGVYTHVLSSVTNCDSTIKLLLSVAPIAFTNLQASICAGESYAFNGQNLSAAGTYTAVLQTKAGCDSTITLVLSVNTVNTNTSVSGGTITAQAANATYQWINCATNQLIQGATNASFTPTATGNYAVQVTQNGCTATSNCVFVQVVSTNEPLGGAVWAVQPNPASDYTQVVFSIEATEGLYLEVLDLAGRTLNSQKVAVGTRSIYLNLSNMPDGMLMVRLVNEHGVSAKRLMKGQN